MKTILKNFYNSKSSSFNNKECSTKYFGESKNGLSKSIEPMGSMKSCRQKTFITQSPNTRTCFKHNPFQKLKTEKD